MYTYKLEACGNKQFLFEFSFNAVDAECGSNGCRYVGFRLLRKDQALSGNTFEWEGCLCEIDGVPFELSFADKTDIKGEMKLYKINGQDFIWVDVLYCYDLERHFEGNIMQIPSDTVLDPIPDPVDPIPGPDPAPSPLPDPVDDVIISGDYDDLFPYLYMKKWPDISKDDQSFFVNYSYKPTSPATTNLYTSFLSNFNSSGMAKKGAREKINEDAFDFVNGVSPYEGQYIGNISSLPAPFTLFPGIYDSIHDNPPSDTKALSSLITEKSNEDIETLSLLMVNSEFLQIKEQVWQNVFALTVLNFYNINSLQDEIKILLVCNLIEYLINDPQTSDLEQILSASVTLPSPIYPLPATAQSQVDPTFSSGTVVPYAIGDLHMIQHKLLGYRLGEIAHIENVLSGELKERSNATSQELNEMSFNSTESKLENSFENELEMDGLNVELLETVKGTDTETNDYNKLESSYGPPTTGTYSGEVTFTKKPDLSNNESTVNFAKKVLDKTIARITKNIKQVFTKKQIRKTEESVVHTLDNREGDQIIRGVYHWVNKIYRARVVNYGNRFLLEFLIDQPFPNTEAGLASLGNSIIPPSNRVDPINSFKDISRKNYASLAADYGVFNVPLPPDEGKTYYALFNGDQMTAKLVNLDDGYSPSQVEVSYMVDVDMKLLVGGAAIELSADQSSTSAGHSVITASLDDTFVVSNNSTVMPVLLNEIASYTSPPSQNLFYVTVGISCIPSGPLMDKWRVSVYDAIMKAYLNNLQEAGKSSTKLQHKNLSKTRDLINKSVINSCKDQLYQLNLEKNSTSQSPLESPVSTISQPAYYQFFDEALEWKEITYEFYEENDSPQQERSVDYLQSQLGGGSALGELGKQHLRAMVPVVPSFNYKMLYYLSTGLISYLSNQVTPVVDPDQSIALAFKKVADSEQKLTLSGDSWEITLPTNMQWLQDKASLPLNEEEEKQ